MSITVLLVDDEENVRVFLSEFLRSQGYSVLAVESLAAARRALAQGEGDVVLLDVQLPDGYGLRLLDELAEQPQRPPVIVITGYYDNVETAVEAMQRGAHDFLTKPISLDRLMTALRRAEEVVRMRRELWLLRQAQQAQEMDFVLGRSPAMRQLLEQAQRAAEASVSVLITGETGTGKEVLARYIHRVGPRADKPFIPINCAAIPETMLEAELFGYEAGAFTGATKRKPGLFEMADQGVLFLDEIASMPMSLQAKLLRLLEERQVRRIGGTRWIPVDVQIIAASNRDLPALIQEGRFRDDLYYRLKVVDLHLPPLRERREDIPELVGFFIARLAPRMGRAVHDITPRALEALMQYHWPGNVRELRNVIERALLFCDGPRIDLEHLPADIVRAYHQRAAQPPTETPAS